MSSGLGGGGAGGVGGGGGGGVAGVLAADGGVSFGGALVSELRSHAASNNSRQLPWTARRPVRFWLAQVMAPLYHGRAWHGSRGHAAAAGYTRAHGNSRRGGPRPVARRRLPQVRRAEAD